MSQIKCASIDCVNIAGKLQCPTCLKLNVASYFCSQDCFKRSWPRHKLLHLQAQSYDPYKGDKKFRYTGKLRAAYPLSTRRKVPEHIPLPDYSITGQPLSEIQEPRNKIRTLTPEMQQKMRVVCRMAREVLDAAAAAIRPGITTDELDKIVHDETIKRNAYPSPLNYYYFPKSVCTSVNEVICHGIPDQRPLQEDDIVNLDVTVYYDGVHGDLNETYYVSEKAKENKDVVRLVETARQSLELAIKLVKPGLAFRDIGAAIEAFAKTNKCSVVRTYCGHGINSLFHSAPSIPHYAKNKAVGIAQPGMTFTIEPMINLGSFRDITWPDNWTAVTEDGSWSAQFEHTLLVTEDGCEVLTARLEDSPGGPAESSQILSS